MEDNKMNINRDFQSYGKNVDESGVPFDDGSAGRPERGKEDGENMSYDGALLLT